VRCASGAATGRVWRERNRNVSSQATSGFLNFELRLAFCGYSDKSAAMKEPGRLPVCRPAAAALLLYCRNAVSKESKKEPRQLGESLAGAKVYVLEPRVGAQRGHNVAERRVQLVADARAPHAT
jgi:hypothetical protein